MKRKYQALHLIKLARHLQEMELTTEDLALIEDVYNDRQNGKYFVCFPYVLKLLPALFEQ